jgi:acetoin:2,6-dichlorophenolindophenol oxidoreductase subunit alpha
MFENRVPDKDTYLTIFRSVQSIFLNDARMRTVLKSGKITVPYYSPRGQEIIPAAVSACLKTADYIVTIYRGIHDQIAKGVPLEILWAEYAGRAGGACKGKGGPMHITHPASGVMVTTGIVGGGLPIANGLALASQIKGDGRVTVCYFGDGASNIGAFHEALNLASIWKLPVVFVCQNNRYAEHTKFEAGTAIDSIAKRADSYSMPSESVDGNNADATWNAALRAVERARTGQGPTLIETNTFRFLGHVVGDDNFYIPKQELSAAKLKDPVPALRAQLIAAGVASEAELGAIDTEINAAIDKAVDFALGSPFPGLPEMLTDVYASEVRS